VVPAVDEPEFEAAAREPVVDAEARRDETAARQEAHVHRVMDPRRRPEDPREQVGREDRERDPDREDLRRVRALLVALLRPPRLAVPDAPEKVLRVPQASRE